MTLEEFLEQNSGAPYEFETVAAHAAKVTDDNIVKHAAKAYLAAQRTLEAVLEDVGYEPG